MKMKGKVSFKMFFTILGRGIWQVVCWVAGMFGYNDKSTYGKVVRRIFAGSVAIVALVFAAVVAYAGYSAVKEDIQERIYRKSELSERQLSQNISYMQNYYTWHDSYLFNYTTGKKMHEGKIAWIIRSEDDDSLAVFSDGKKRGYINRFTGEIQIPAEYDHAWIFSDDVACVQKGNVASFIDHQGNQICDKQFAPPVYRGYVFYKGYCAVSLKENDWGLIDKDGSWILDGHGYENIRHEFHAGKHYWVITAQDGKEGVLTEILGRTMEMWYSNIDFDETGIYATDSQGWRKKYDFDGKVIEDFVMTDVGTLAYDTDVRDKNGETITKPSRCWAYFADDNHCGLMSDDGKPLTPAIYTGIEALSPNRFLCHLAWNEKVMLDEQGRKVEKIEL